jgi:hypothetical protein
MKADIFTKNLAFPRFLAIRSKLGMDTTWGVCQHIANKWRLSPPFFL